MLEICIGSAKRAKGEPMSYKAEVIADSSGKWVGNGLAFATHAEADQYATDLFSRWTAVRDCRVVESDEPVSYSFVEGKLLVISDREPL